MNNVEVNAQFLDLSKNAEIQLAIQAGMINATDSPKGFLCTLCGCVVASQELHIEYHAGMRTIIRGMQILLGSRS